MAPLPCPSCAAPVPAGSFACPRCTLAVRAEAGRLVPIFPAIEAGPPLYTADLGSELPAGFSADRVQASGVIRLERGADGLGVEVSAGKALEWTNPYMGLRDACVRVAVARTGPTCRVVLTARSAQLGDAWSEYGFCVEPRRACLARLLGGRLGTSTVFTAVGDRQAHAGLEAAGSLLEFRVLGPTLEGRVDGRRVVVTHDPVLGMGRCGFRVEGQGGPATVLLRRLEIAGVAP